LNGLAGGGSGGGAGDDYYECVLLLLLLLLWELMMFPLPWLFQCCRCCPAAAVAAGKQFSCI
jgi:hypothetical protein